MKSYPAPLHHRASKVALTIMVLAMTSPAHAATFTWDGGHISSNSWGSSDNWNPNVVPTFDNQADLSFDTLTRPSNFIADNRTVRSLTFGGNIDSAYAIRYVGFAPAQVARNLTMEANSGNATITVASGATGDINLGLATGDTGSYGTMILADNLDIVHHGSGLLLFNRPISGTGFGITKTGTGTMQLANQNNFTGNISVNEGRLIVSSATTDLDLDNSPFVNLGGGTLEVRTGGVFNKTFDTAALNVTAASSLAYNNTTANTQTMTLSAAAMSLGASLKVQNISSGTSLNNLINISRNITGSGDLIVETYNNITASANSFTLGRVQLSGDNSGWSGDLVIAKGTAQLSGGNASGTGDMVIGTTGDSFGAGLAVNQGTDLTLTNNITVRSGGFRAIKNNGSGAINIAINGDIALEGSLTVDHSLDADKSITLGGGISGDGGLNITRSGGSAGSYVLVTGDNSYTGATTVSSGRLTIGSTGTINTTSGVSIGAGEFRYNSTTALSQTVSFSSTGGRLSGDGAITPSVTVSAGNTLAPGNGIGNLTLHNGLNLAGIFEWDLAGLSTASPGTDYDTLTISGGNATLSGASLVLNLGVFAPGADPFWQTNQTWAGILNNTGSGTLIGTFAAIDNSAWSSLGSFTTTYSGNDVNLQWSAVPEPTSALASLLITAGVLRRRRG